MLAVDRIFDRSETTLKVTVEIFSDDRRTAIQNFARDVARIASLDQEKVMHCLKAHIKAATIPSKVYDHDHELYFGEGRSW
jgi:hypothetical protein